MWSGMWMWRNQGQWWIMVMGDTFLGRAKVVAMSFLKHFTLISPRVDTKKRGVMVTALLLLSRVTQRHTCYSWRSGEKTISSSVFGSGCTCYCLHLFFYFSSSRICVAYHCTHTARFGIFFLLRFRYVLPWLADTNLLQFLLSGFHSYAEIFFLLHLGVTVWSAGVTAANSVISFPLLILHFIKKLVANRPI